MGQPDHLVIPFDKHGADGQRSTLEAMKITFNQPFSSIGQHSFLQRQLSSWRIGSIGSPTESLLESRDSWFLANDGGDLVTHVRDDLLGALSRAAAATDELDLLFFLRLKR